MCSCGRPSIRLTHVSVTDPPEAVVFEALSRAVSTISNLDTSLSLSLSTVSPDVAYPEVGDVFE